MIRNVFFILFFPALFLADISNAQQAFEKTRISVTGHRVLSGNTIMKHWDPSNGFGFDLSAPYFFGNFDAGYRYTRFNEFSFENSGFHSHYVYAGWSYSYMADDHLLFTTGIRLGNNFMLYDQDMIYDGEYRFSREESEIAYELHTKLQLEMTPHSEFFVSFAYSRTILNIPLAAYYGTIGVTIKFDTPGWLKNFLR